MIEQKLQSKVQPREVSTTSIGRPIIVYPVSTRAARFGRRTAPASRFATGAGSVAPERVPVAEPETGDLVQRPFALERADRLAKRHVALTANDDVDAELGMRPRLRRQARVVATDDDADIRFQGSDERDDSPRRRALERHHRQADDVRGVC